MPAPNPDFTGTFLAGNEAQYNNWLTNTAPRLTSAVFAWLRPDGNVYGTTFAIAFQGALALAGANLAGSSYLTYPTGFKAYVFPDTTLFGAFAGTSTAA